MKILPHSFWAKTRFGLLLLILLIVVGDVFVVPFYWVWQYQAQEGDLIFESLVKSELVALIEGTTHSEFSHVGVLRKKGNGDWVVVEAFTTVHETPLWLYIARSRWDHFAVYRLRSQYRPLIPAFIRALDPYYGRPYDFRYDMDDEYIYCSELPYKAFYNVSRIHLGQTKRLGDLDWKPFESVIRKYENGHLPLDRVMITPIDLARAPQLELILNNGYTGL